MPLSKPYPVHRRIYAALGLNGLWIDEYLMTFLIFIIFLPWKAFIYTKYFSLPYSVDVIMIFSSECMRDRELIRTTY